MTGIGALDTIRAVLGRYTFAAANEHALQGQVHGVLVRAGLHADREVRSDRGTFDIRVQLGGAAIVLELKVRGAAAAVERQAQRYALTEGVDAVAIVTTSQRLAHALLRPGDVGQAPSDTLGGKPFGVITLRAF